MADDVLKIFGELRDAGTTVLLVGESPHGIVDIADHVSLIHVGRIVWSGPASSLDDDTLAGAYFGEAPVQ